MPSLVPYQLTHFAALQLPTEQEDFIAPRPTDVAIRALSIDGRCQGKGIGTAAMQAVPELVRQHFPQADHILLVVNARNAHARRVYEKAGYTVWFGRDGGEHGPQWVMRRELGALQNL